VTSSDEKGRETVYDCLMDGNFPWLAPVGRLDKASEGLLLLTNDNRWAADILDPQTHVEKTYHVQIDRIADENLILLRQFAKSPLFPLAKGGNCYPPLWPPAHRASLRGMSPSGAEPDLEGKEGRGEIF
jgi:hypothetical protein